MILLVQIICLCYTLYVLQEYATSGAYSRQHRPLLVGLIGVYNFYQVVLTLTGQTELFGRLKDMLLIQVLYLILIYIMDFLKIHIPYGVQWIMFCVLLHAGLAAQALRKLFAGRTAWPAFRAKHETPIF